MPERLTRNRTDDPDHARERDAETGVADRDDRHALQRDKFGGVNWGSAFFGWLVAVGMAALLTALLGAAGAAVGLTAVNEGEARGAADEISLAGGIALVVVLLIAYYCGGYVAGRMSRFDGGRQGIGAWLFGLLITILLAAAGAIAGSKYNVLSKLNLPSIPVNGESFATGGVIALAVILIATLIAAFLGGKAGERYHRKVDRAGGVA